MKWASFFEMNKVLEIVASKRFLFQEGGGRAPEKKKLVSSCSILFTLALFNVLCNEGSTVFGRVSSHC